MKQGGRGLAGGEAGAEETQIPIPEGVRRALRPWALVGRDTELEAIAAERAGAAERGERRLVLVRGEPGIGKTRLAAEAARAAHAAGANVLYGHHDPEAGGPGQGFGEALEHLGAHADEGLLAELGPEVRALEAIAPGLVRRLPPAPDGAHPVAVGNGHALFLATASVLAAAARRRPLVLLLDDLHAADESTVALLRHVLLGPFPMAMLALVTYRDHELGERAAGVLGEVAVRLPSRELDLAGLDAEEIGALAEELGHGGSPRVGALAAALLRETKGNPLFVSEILRGLPELDEGAITNPPLPRSLRDAVRARVRGMGDAAAELLELAAVVGPEFDAAVLERAAGRGPEELAEVLGAAERAGILDPRGAAGRYRFAHSVIQRSLCDSQAPAERGRRHRLIAEGLEALARIGSPPPARELALHWARARPPDAMRTVTWSRRAGEEALAALEPRTAARFFAQALEVLDQTRDDPGLRSELLVGLGEAQRRQGDPAFRETLLEAGRLAERIGDRDLLVRAALANSRGIASSAGEVDGERVGLLERALAQVDPGDERPRSSLLAALARELAFSDDRERRTRLAAEAVAVARRSGDRAGIAAALIATFMPAWTPDSVRERLAEMRESVGIADELGDPVLQFHALHWQTVALLQAGEVAGARASFAREERLARRLGDAVAPWLASLDRCCLAVVTGTLAEAERLAERSLELGTESGQPDALPFYASQIACIRWHQGRLAELLPLAQEVVATKPQLPAFRSLLALCHVEAGERERAAAVLAADAAERFQGIPVDLGWPSAMVTYAHVAADVGDVEAARTLRALLSGLSGQVAYTGMSVWGPVDWALGRLAALLGDHEEARELLGGVAQRAERDGARLWQARALYSLAAELPCEPGDGPPQAARAAEVAALAGAAEIERRARLLVGDNGRGHATEPLDLSGLTPRQADVIRLVARGLTNQRIADRLGISQATVKRHLEAVYGRLGARSRAEAVAKLMR